MARLITIITHSNWSQSMPDNKKHHFVPKVYLKNFSSNAKVINLYNVAGDKFVLGAALKAQCYRDYFYGHEPTLEKALGTIEGVAAKLFREIVGSETPPEDGSVEYAELVTFIVFQRNRTIQAARAIEEMVSSMAKRVVSYHPEFNGELSDDIELSVSDPAVHGLKAASHTLPFAMDLTCKLLIAKPGSEFITSDNPVVFYNQALESVRGHHGIGTASKGLQVFFPISPACMILLYDGSVYKVGGRRERTVRLSQQRDMDQINTLVLANAEENIYFLHRDKINFRDIEHGVKYRGVRTSEINVVNEHGAGFRGSDLLIHQGVRPKVGLRLSFVKQLSSADALRYICERGVIKHPGLVRDPALVELVDRWQKALDGGSHQNFHEFMNSQA